MAAKFRPSRSHSLVGPKVPIKSNPLIPRPSERRDAVIRPGPNPAPSPMDNILKKAGRS